MSYLSYIKFDVKEGQQENFLKLFEATGMLTRPTSIEGYHWGKLAAAEDDKTFIVVAEWASKADYVHWQAISLKGLDPTLMKEFLLTLNDPRPGSLFKTLVSNP